MKIAFVHDWLNGMRGGEKVLEALLDMWPDADIFTLFYEPESISETIRRRKITPSILNRSRMIRSRYRNFLPLFPWAIRRFDLSEYDLTVSISHCVAKSAPAPPERHLCYILSPMRYLWGQTEAYANGGDTSAATRLAMRMLAPPLRCWDRKTSRRAGHFVSISKTIQKRVKDSYNRVSSIIYPPVETDFYTPVNEPRSDYFLVVSAFVPYKRVDLAVEACARLNLPLKIVGGGPGEDRLRAMAGPSIEFLGRVDDDSLRDLYRRCRALLFPPFEDFGIAPVEAQACGRPVIAYRGGGATETVIEGRTGAFFDHQSADSLAEALRVFDPAAFDPAECRAQAERFSRDRFLREFRAETESFLEARGGAVG